MLSNWNFVRVLRLLLAIASAIYAFTSREYFFLLWTGLLGYQVVANKSCCGSHGCSVNLPKNKD